MSVQQALETDVYSFVLARPQGVAAKDLDKDYADLFGGLPTEKLMQLGLRSLLEIANHHSKIKKEYRGGMLHFIAVATEDTKDLHSLIRKQQKPRNRRGGRKNHTATFHFGQYKSSNSPSSSHSKFQYNTRPKNFSSKINSTPAPLFNPSASKIVPVTKTDIPLTALVDRMFQLLKEKHPVPITLSDMTRTFYERYNMMVNPNEVYGKSWVSLYKENVDKKKFIYLSNEYIKKEGLVRSNLDMTRGDEPGVDQQLNLTLPASTRFQKVGKPNGVNMLNSMVQKNVQANKKIDLNRAHIAMFHNGLMYSDKISSDQIKQKSTPSSSRSDNRWVHDKYREDYDSPPASPKLNSSKKKSTVRPAPVKHASHVGKVDFKDNQAARQESLFSNHGSKAQTSNYSKVVSQPEKKKTVYTESAFGGKLPWSATSYYKINTVNSGQMTPMNVPNTLIVDDSIIEAPKSEKKIIPMAKRTSSSNSNTSSISPQRGVTHSYYNISIIGKYEETPESICSTLEEISIRESKEELRLAEMCEIDDDDF